MSNRAADQRVIAHIDMDCFYVQVEAALDPSLKGVPCAVVQYNPYGELKTYHYSDNRRNVCQNGGIIAVNYEARGLGVKRHMRGAEASRVCPSVQLIQVPTTHGKADITVYRKAGEDVVRVLSSLFDCPVEKASIDEVYLDLTEECRRRLQDDDYQHGTVPRAQSAAVLLPTGALTGSEGGHWMSGGLSEEDQLLVCGAAAAQELRDEVLKQLGYTCSAGVAHNKMLAKIASSSHKPNKQAMIPSESVSFVMNALPIEKIPGYGGKLGEAVKAALDVNTVGELRNDSNGLQRLIEKFGPSQGQEIWKTLSGIDNDIVKARSAQSIISCGKQFPDKLALNGTAAWQPGGDVDMWVKNLCCELGERLIDDKAQNNRVPRVVGVSVSFKLQKGKKWSDPKNMSESCAMPSAYIQVEATIGSMLRSLLSSYITDTAGSLNGFVDHFGDIQSDQCKKIGPDDVYIGSLFVKASGFISLPEAKEQITRFFNAGASATPVFSVSSLVNGSEMKTDVSGQLSEEASPPAKPCLIQNYFSKKVPDNLLQKSTSNKRRKIDHDISLQVSTSSSFDPAVVSSVSKTAVSANSDAVIYNEDNLDYDVLNALPEELRDEILHDICANAEKKLLSTKKQEKHDDSQTRIFKNDQSITCVKSRVSSLNKLHSSNKGGTGLLKSYYSAAINCSNPPQNK